ncbi:hypothetical protein PQO01_17550 [Lentisphaera marina]|uniref:hypothetical protein n=1 Tax=Lentisphaera marina TaxID=1111041 RepID=UPI002365A582|nr:hypothetical protein [Lentisphaera marina]MDD7986758.1 hypothetical protein [Lentisphaera marina]
MQDADPILVENYNKLIHKATKPEGLLMVYDTNDINPHGYIIDQAIVEIEKTKIEINSIIN